MQHELYHGIEGIEISEGGDNEYTVNGWHLKFEYINSDGAKTFYINPRKDDKKYIIAVLDDNLYDMEDFKVFSNYIKKEKQSPYEYKLHDTDVYKSSTDLREITDKIIKAINEAMREYESRTEDEDED